MASSAPRLQLLLRMLRLIPVALVLAACHPNMQPPMGGSLAVGFTTAPVDVTGLTLTSATMHLAQIVVLGDRPPPGPPMPAALTLDLVAGTGGTLELDLLPPAVYSRVEFVVDNISLQGSWRGTPLTAMIGMFGGIPVKLRSANGEDVGPGMNGTFTVTADPNQWFAGDLLDSAVIANGQITCDGANNMVLGMMLAGRVPPSFTLQ